MDTEGKIISAVFAVILCTVWFITWQVQETNRQFIKAGYTRKPILTTSYSTGWTREAIHDQE